MTAAPTPPGDELNLDEIEANAKVSVLCMMNPATVLALIAEIRRLREEARRT